MKKKQEGYQVWECKIVVAPGVELPGGFDSPPRWGAIDAIEDYEGIKVIACFSGWGGKLSVKEKIIADQSNSKKGGR